MSAEVLTPSRLAGGRSPTSDSVSQALETFQAVRSRAARWVLRLLPWIILSWVILVEIVISKASDPMHISGMVAAALSLFASQFLMQRIPEILGTLWNRNLIASKPTTDLDGANPTEEVLNTTANPSKPAPVEDTYRTFIHDVEGLLNHPGQWLIGVFFALLVLTWAHYHWYELIGESFIGFIIGIMAWRMIVTGVQVWQLGKKFDLTPQSGHPDKCGGFEPLGNLCLWNALIVTIPAVFLWGWIILGPGTQYGNFYTPQFSKLLLVPVAWAMLSFFLPLWSVHQIMIAKRAVVRQQLDQLSKSINHLAREMLAEADELEPEEGEKMAEKLELMRQIYQQNQHYPVWPFNLGIMVKFMTSQAVPILGLVSHATNLMIFNFALS